MLCGVAGIDNSTIDNSASYINNWMRKLDDDPKLIVHLAAAAKKRQTISRELNMKRFNNC